MTGVRFFGGKPENIDTFQVKFINSDIPTIDGYEYVDLGLPSGTLWAKCNVGAETETDYGLYFAWGEIWGYTADQVGTDKNFTWADYKFNPTGDGTTFTKYSATDGKTTLDLGDDAAHANMGGKWKMPTITQIEELCNLQYATHEVISNYNDSGVSGMLFTSVANNATLFVPFVGKAENDSVLSTRSGGFVWSCSLHDKDVSFAFYLGVDDEPDASSSFDLRHLGFSVRGVCTQNTSGKTSKNENEKEAKP